MIEPVPHGEALLAETCETRPEPGTMPDLLVGSPAARLVLPETLTARAIGLDLPGDRLVGLVAGGRHEDAGFAVRAVPSAHEGLDTDDRGRPIDFGYVVEADGSRMYHGGDSLAYDGLADARGTDLIDVLFLPINGRDPARGVAGEMSGAAVTLAAAIRPRFLVPHH